MSPRALRLPAAEAKYFGWSKLCFLHELAHVPLVLRPHNQRYKRALPKDPAEGEQRGGGERVLGPGRGRRRSLRRDSEPRAAAQSPRAARRRSATDRAGLKTSSKVAVGGKIAPLAR